MGKVTEKLKLTNAFDARRKLEIEAVIDTGATMLVLPQTVVRRLNLRKRTTVTARYANGKTATKPVYGVVQLQIGKRVGDFDVLAEDDGGQALVGQIVLEQLDLVVDPRRKRLIPNPQSPDLPMMEIL
jgi:predicted aspartyl protease